MGFRFNGNPLPKPKEWTPSQKETVKRINAYLKENCFKPKNNLMFISTEINSYRVLLEEIESLPYEVIKFDDYKYSYIKIKDIETLSTKFQTKKYLLVRKIFEMGGKVIYGGKNKSFRMVKLATVRGLIYERIKKISSENVDAYRVWGNAFQLEKPVFEQVVKKRIYKKFTGLKKKVADLSKESEPKSRYNKYIISLEFQKEIESYIAHNIGWIHFTSDLFKSLNMVTRTVYRWKQDGKFSMDQGLINIEEFYSFAKGYPKKFEIVKEV